MRRLAVLGNGVLALLFWLSSLVLELGFGEACAEHSVAPSLKTAALDAGAHMDDAGVQGGDDAARSLDADELVTDAGLPPSAATTTEPAEERQVLEGQLDNARDLGGIALAGGAVVRDGVLFRGRRLRI